MSVANLLKLTLHWSGYGEEGTLSWAFSGNQAQHTPAQLQSAASAALSAWSTVRTPSSKTSFLSLITSAQTVDKVTLYEYATAPGPVSELGLVTPSGWTGTGGVASPLQVCAVASLRTATAGASYRGRQYFPCHTLPPDANTMQLVSANVDKFGNLAANMGPEAASAIATSLSISTLRWCVFSPTKGITTEITGVVVDSKLDTQRRREAGLVPSIVKTYSV